MITKRILAWAACLALILAGAAASAAAAGQGLPPAEFADALSGPAAQTVREGGYVEISFSSPEAGGMDGVIETSDNLELVGFTSTGISAQLSADDHVVTIFGDPVTYVYKVNEEAGQDVSVRLTEAECTDGAGGLFSMTDENWEAEVLPAGEEHVPVPAMLEAADVMAGPEGSVPAGGTVDIVFLSPAGGGMDGEIRVSDNLTFESMRSEDLGAELSAKDHVVSLFADPVTYTYRVNAEPGETVSVELVNVKTADEYRNLYSVPEQLWTGTVGEPDGSSAVQPLPAEPDPVGQQPDPDASFMITPDRAVEGRCIEVQFTSPDDGGLEGYIETSDNLVFEGLRGGFLSTELSSERKAVSLFGEPLTYVYRVEAEAGDSISVSLARGQQSDGSCSLSPVAPESWNCTVQADAAAEPPQEFVPMMTAPDEVVSGSTIDVSFLSPVDGGMNGIVSTSANLVFEGTVSAGNGARLSTDDKVRSLLGVPVTYRYRVTGEAGSPVYVRLTEGRTADAGTNMTTRVRNQIWMGVVQEAPATNCVISPAAGSAIRIGESGTAAVEGTFLTGASGSVGSLLGQLSAPDSMTLEVIRPDGSPLHAAAELATGQVVQACADGQPVASAVIVVAGDVTGNGTLGIGQLVRLAAACMGTKPLQGAYLLAGDMNGNRTVDVGDMALFVHQLQAGR